MTKIKSFVFIILEFVFGLGFGFLGGQLFSLVDTWDITYSVLFTFIAIFAAIPVGVGLIGYFHLRILKMRMDFARAILTSLFGLFLFIGFYVLIDSIIFGVIPHYWSSVIMPILIPLIGTVLGFNYTIQKNRRTIT